MTPESANLLIDTVRDFSIGYIYTHQCIICTIVDI